MTEHEFPASGVDRTGWDPGPWDAEPDRLQWTTKAGYVGLIVRSNLGALCGYVGVPEGHHAHGKGYDDLEVSVHGGLNYAHQCQGHICHAPEPGQPDRLYWFGFDCAHMGDLIPSREPMLKALGFYQKHPEMARFASHGTYRDVDYVKAEVELLAEQLKEMDT